MPSMILALLSLPIIGGSPVNLGDFPAVVAITVDVGADRPALCTGELIDPEWVLTAAHCVEPSEFAFDTESELLVHMEVNFATTSVITDLGRVVLPDQVIENPAYAEPLFHHDVGLIHLSSPVNDIAPVTVSFDPANAAVGTLVTQVGYGVFDHGGLSGSAGDERVIDGRAIVGCDGEAPDAPDRGLCYDQTDGNGKCFGDSGGPSFATIGGQLVLVGTTSTASVNCDVSSRDTPTDTERAFVVEHVPGIHAIEPPAAGSGSGDEPGDDDETPGSGGCSTNRDGGGWLVLLAIVGFVARVRAPRYMSRHATRNARGCSARGVVRG